MHINVGNSLNEVRKEQYCQIIRIVFDNNKLNTME